MRHPLELIFPPEIGLQLIYSFVIILCSLMIYYSTKEIYELSSYKGLKYFRRSFLFFAIAYFFRYFIAFFLFLLNIKEIIDLSPGYIFGVSMFLFLYFSSMGIFYLVYSVMWKTWNHSKTKIFLFNVLALIIAFIGTIFGGPAVSLILNVVLLIFLAAMLLAAYKDHKSKQKGKSLFVIYLLLSLFWVLNMVDVMLPSFLQLYQILMYLISISIFMAILSKVLKKSGS